MDELNYQFLRRLQQEGFITLKSLFIDGTKIEANANRYTFVWRGTLNYHLAGLDVYKRQRRDTERSRHSAKISENIGEHNSSKIKYDDTRCDHT